MAAPGPGRRLVRYDAIAVLLFLLVLGSALGIEPGITRRLRRQIPRLIAVLACSTVIGVSAAWLASQFVGDTNLRHGVLALGVAPAEIATVAMASLAGADSAIAAALLVASTGLTVLLGGPIIGALAGSTVDTTGTIVELGIVVGIPMVTGLALRSAARRVPLVGRAISPTSVALVLVLVFLVASEIHLSSAYLVVAAVIVGFVAATTGAALLVGRLVEPAAQPAAILSVAVRDFAVAGGIATAAFGPKAAGPLGIYGVVVIASGAGLVRWLRPRPGMPLDPVISTHRFPE